MTKQPKKLIEVALPLEAINVASAREKSIRHGHPSTLHLWWARRPLAAARAVIFAQMVDDPSEHTDILLTDPAKKRAATRELAKRRIAWDKRTMAYDAAGSQSSAAIPEPGPEPTLQECIADIERERLFDIIRELVKWENTTNEDVLQKARDEIWQSWRYACAANADHPQARELFDRYKLPAFHDPFAGGGALPLEAQRLGLEAYASDLNPVAVLINKAMIEIPPKFAGRPPVNPESRRQMFGKDAEFRQEKQEEQDQRGGQDLQELQDVRSGRQDLQELQDQRGRQDLQELQDLEEEGLDSLSVPVTPVIPVSPISLVSPVLPVSPVTPVHSDGPVQSSVWRGAQGLAEDVRYYGKWMRDEAEKRIGHLYPKIEITAEMVLERPDLKRYLGQKLTVIAWLWARTVKSPNPAFAHIDVPLVSTFMLSTKEGKEAYVEPLLSPFPSPRGRGVRGEGQGGYRFTVKIGKPKDAEAAKNGTKLARANFVCLMSNTPITGDYIKAEGKAGRMGARLMAIVAEGERGRVYLAPTTEHEAIAKQAEPTWRPEGDVPARLTGGTCVPYGLSHWGDLFTPRQLVALTTFSDLAQESRERVKRDALATNLPDDHRPLAEGGIGDNAYADAVLVYLGFVVDKCGDYWSSICTWHNSGEKMRNTFGRQAIQMTWDYAEANPFCASSGNWMAMVDWTWKATATMPTSTAGNVCQGDAQSQSISMSKVVSTDPPYYDNIAYADLSDFFYVWLRRSLRPVFPNLFATLVVPKAEELVATQYRHGSKEKAEAFFLDGMTQAMHRLAEQSHPAFPVTIYYAFKQAESDGNDGATNTGWDTFLDAVIRAGFAVTGTWPMRTELGNRMIGSGANALASSIVLVCRKRAIDAPTATRREFVTALKSELPIALTHLQRGNIAPVDLAQAAIGPGMAIFTRYAKVLDAAGRSLTVREALALINEILGEVLAEQEGDFDVDSRWALAWFDQYAFDDGEYGVAETLSKAKNTSVTGMVEAGILSAGHGKVRLLRPEKLQADWDPTTDKRLTTWEVVHQLIRVLETQGEVKASALAAKLGPEAEVARELCYRLYTLCERKKRAAEALSYNGLVQSWPEIMRLARESRKDQPGQAQLL